MDYSTNFRRSGYGRSQMFRNSSGIPVGMQCCMQPDMPSDTQQTMPSGYWPSMPSGSQQTMPSGSQQTMPSGSQQTMPSGSQQTMPSGSQQTMPSGSHANMFPNAPACPGTVAGPIEQYPIGMGYVPMQQWGQTYTLEQGLSRGTIFPELDLPFLMGRCQ